MTTLSIRLVAELYCAIPWGRANCEGKVEWPPSPWRLFRSMLAGGYRARLNEPKMTLLRAAVTQLGQVSPRYHLPDATQRMLNSPRPTPIAPSKHQYARRNGQAVMHGKPKDLRDVQYCFAEGATIWVQFPEVTLTRKEERVLSQALAHCRYIGRAEAQADWAIEDDEAMPTPNTVAAAQGFTQVASWDGRQVDDLLFDPKSQQGAKAIAKTPPGLIWQFYNVSARVNGLQPRSPSGSEAPKVMRFLLMGEHPIHRHNLLSYAQRLHQSLAKSEQPVLSGRQANGEPIRGSWHSYLIPLLDGDHLVGFDVYAAAGFNQEAQLHAMTIQRLWNRDGSVRCSLVQVLPQLISESGHIWRNITPVLPGLPRRNHRGRTRFLRGCGNFIQGGPEHQALRSLTRLPGFSQWANAAIEYRAPNGKLQAWSNDECIATVTRCIPRLDYLTQWRVMRPNRPKPTGTLHDIELTFAKEQHTLIAIGINAHYGMGQMRPVLEGIAPEGGKHHELL